MTRQALREASDRNYTAAFAALIPHVAERSGATRAFGQVTAVVTELPIAFYNPVLVTRPDADPRDVSEGVQWIRSGGLLASVQLRDDLHHRFDPAIRDLGLQPENWASPGMGLHPVPAPPPTPRELKIEIVGPESFSDWHEGIAYGPGFERIFGPTLVDDAAFRLVVAYAEGQPVAGAAAILSERVVGIDAVGTAEHARRRGFGAALTSAAIETGVAAGCDVAVLQSSEMAAELYRRMGFVEVRRYLEYQPRQA